MSQENVEVVRRGLEAFNQGDIDGALDMYDPQVEVRTLLSGSAHGRHELRAVILEREKAMVRVTAKGPLSGISDKDFPAGQQLAFVWTLRGGLVIRQEMFSSKAEALEAVELRD